MKLQIAGVLIATSLLAVSCSNDTEDIKLIEKNSAVTLTVTPTVQSRVTTTGTTTAFVSGDNIAVTSTGLANNMSETVLTVGEDGKTLTSTEEFFYNGNNEATFYAWYPSTIKGSATSAAFTVATDQSTDGAFAANDFMTAQSTGKASEKTSLTFTHQLAWVKVTVDAETDAEVAVTINGAQPTATYTYADDKVATSGESTNITMGKHDTEFWALIPAQSFDKDAAMLAITVGTTNYTFTPTSAITFETGNVKKISLTIANGVVIEADISAEQWADGGSIKGSIFKKE